EHAGAVIVGPFSTAHDAMRAIEQTPPDCAVLDINLGDGPEFGFARELKKQGIPTVFVSGYQAAMIPADLKDFAYLEKPAEHHSLVRAVREAMQDANKS